MKKLLFLCHRIPYPPTKGDKIRSFHLLKHLAQHYRVYLGTFADDAEDWRYVPELSGKVEELYVLRIRPRWGKFLSLRGLISGEALSLPYYRNSKMQRWVNKTLEAEHIERVIVYSSPMAQYVQESRFQKLHRVVDFVDADSEKWRQYSVRHHWPLSWLYQREGEELLRFERDVAKRFDATVFVSQHEANLFRKLAPESHPYVNDIRNGVDTEYFFPEKTFPNPYSASGRVLVFTGAMDYWANVDGCDWFARDVFPRIRAQVPDAQFYIVGARPTRTVRKLGHKDGVCVTGAVKDIRPYLAHASAAVAPLRIARGLQNKVLEAMAMGKPVLATRAAMEGLDLDPSFGSLISAEAAELADRGIELLTAGDTGRLGARGRDFVSRNYDWSRSLAKFERLLEQGFSRHQSLAINPHGEAAIPRSAPGIQETLS